MFFKVFNEKIKHQALLMCQGGLKLFRSSVPGSEIWDLYLSSFRPEDDPVFRDPESSKHNGNLDKSFIRRYGNIVTVDNNNNIITLFDVDLPEDSKYYRSAKAISEKLKSETISGVFFETFEELNSMNYEKTKKTQVLFRLGLEKNHKIYTQEEVNKFGVVEAGKVYEFNHFHIDIPKTFVDFSGKSVQSVVGTYRDAKQVFKRGLDEIPLDTLQLVRDLINQGSLLNGEAHLYKIEKILPLKEVYDNLPAGQKDNWCWKNSYGFEYAKFKNELIGVLCSDLEEGVELNKACQDWNKRVDPANYMKATAPITKRQIEEAKSFVEENGYEESFDRRFASIDDIDVSEIIHSSTSTDKVKNASIFDNVEASKSTRHKKSQFEGIEEVNIENFMKNILPSSRSVEVFLENRMEGNLVSLTTASSKDSKKIFKWNNNYSWTYKGNLTGKSEIKTAVGNLGGKVDGVLRFSIMWADNDKDNSDLDAHCKEPTGHIWYSNKVVSSGGNLDIDITNPQDYLRRGHKTVENITYPRLSSMRDGEYEFFVNQFISRNSKGFKAEIEFNGEIFEYEYKKPLTNKQNIPVATVTLKNGEFTIKHSLPEKNSNKKVWNLETNNFHKVNLVCLSPNHWGENNQGNKHYMFMLDKCKSDRSLRSFHNENLNGDLLKHRKVMEVLANTTQIEPSEKQLAGLGFNSTVRDNIIVRLTGSHKRTVKIKF